MAVAAATLELALVAYLQMEEAQEAAKANLRPILVPNSAIPVTDDFWNESEYKIMIANLGPGPALNVWGVMLPPVIPQRSTIDQYYLRSETPIASKSAAESNFFRGGTVFLPQQTIDKFTLGVPEDLAPEPGIPDSGNRRDRCIARLTLSYSDAIGRKYASIFDFTTTKKWVCVSILNNISRDLHDLDSAKSKS